MYMYSINILPVVYIYIYVWSYKIIINDLYMIFGESRRAVLFLWAMNGPWWIWLAGRALNLD